MRNKNAGASFPCPVQNLQAAAPGRHTHLFFHLPVSGRRSVFSIKLDFDLQFRDAAVDRSDQVLQQGPG